MQITDSPSVHAWTFERALRHVRARVQLGGRSGAVTHEEIAQTAVDLDCCIWHASHVTFRRAYDAGRIPTDTCSLCGGRNRAGGGDHSLCRARVERHAPERFAELFPAGLPVLDVVGAIACGCYPCQRGISLEEWNASLLERAARS